MKRAISLAASAILLLSMLYSLTGCNGEDEQIIGSWQASINYADVVNDVLYSNNPEKHTKSFLLPTTFTFLSDGTYSIVVDTSRIALMIFHSDYKLGQLADRLGKEVRGFYRAQDGKLYLTTDTDMELTETNYDTYQIESDTLTLLECRCHMDEGFENISAFLYPITLTRVAE